MRFFPHITLKTLAHLFIVGLLFLILGFILGHIGDFLERDIVQEYIKNTGIWGPVIFSVVLLVTFVIAPLTGFPIVVVGIGAFGVGEAVVLTYCVSMLGAAINFHIARKFGRGVVVRFVGRKGLEKIDKLAQSFGLEMLVVSRIFQGFLFEWISYAAGLTNVTFRTFFLATLVASTPYFVIVYFYASRISDLTELFVKIALTNYVLLPIPFLYFVTKKTS